MDAAAKQISVTPFTPVAVPVISDVPAGLQIVASGQSSAAPFPRQTKAPLLPCATPRANTDVAVKQISVTPFTPVAVPVISDVPAGLQIVASGQSTAAPFPRQTKA